MLVEPEEAYHEPFLKPLLAAPNSKYHLRSWPTSECFDLHRYINEGLIPSSRTEEGPPNRNRRNDSVLVLNNVTRSEIVRKGMAQPSSIFAALTFNSSAQRMDNLHAQGQVRMLMWMREAEKQALLPRTVFHRIRLSLLLETDWHVEEIVTGDRQTRSRRETFLDVESGRRVAERMQAAGINIPQNRQSETQRLVQDILVGKLGNAPPIVEDARRIEREKELQQLEAAFANKEFEQFDGNVVFMDPKRGRKPTGKHTYTPEFKRLQELRHLRTFEDKKRRKLENALKEEAEVDALDSQILHGNMSPQDKETAISRRDQLYAAFKSWVSSQTTTFPRELEFLGDDRRALALQPELLMWDRREAEPLLARGDEFVSPEKASLMDMRPLTPKPYPMNQEQAVYYDYILKNLLYHSCQTLNDLSHLAPGAFEALAPQVPSLKDPLRGGRANLTDLRVRCLTPEMAHGLALAWDEWPFKPDMLDMIGSDKDLRRFETPPRGPAMGRLGP